MDEDLLNKLSEILADKNINISQVLESVQATSSDEKSEEDFKASSQIDTETIIKIQKLLSILNSKKRFK